MPLADNYEMERCGLIQNHEAMRHNIYLLASLINSWGLSEHANQLSKSLALVGEGHVYDTLELVQKDEFLIRYFPSISEAASYIYASPEKAASILDAKFIGAKDLDYYGLHSYSIECKTYFSIGFRDAYAFHKVWDLKNYPSRLNTSKGKVLLKYTPIKGSFISLESLAEQEVTFQVFFEKSHPMTDSANSFKNACTVCAIDKALIAEFKCKNTEQEISSLVNYLYENTNAIAESGEIIVGLR
jgi:hypothetical protein